MKRNFSIDEQWALYERSVMSRQAGPVQRRETRAAFYAGAHAVFHGIIGMLDSDAEPTEADLSKMDRLRAEIDAGANKVLADAIHAGGNHD